MASLHLTNNVNESLFVTRLHTDSICAHVGQLPENVLVNDLNRGVSHLYHLLAQAHNPSGQASTDKSSSWLPDRNFTSSCISHEHITVSGPQFLLYPFCAVASFIGSRRSTSNRALKSAPVCPGDVYNTIMFICKDGKAGN